MERDQIKRTLQELHQQLGSGQPLDPEVREMLQQISGDIDRLALASPANPPAAAGVPAAEEKETLLDRLLDLTEQFEESHPDLARTIGQLAAALSRIGI